MYNVFVLAAKTQISECIQLFFTPILFLRIPIAISSVRLGSISVWQGQYSKVKPGKDCRISPTTFEGLVFRPLKSTVRLMWFIKFGIKSDVW
jgi:hypothetical protein